MEKKKIYAHIDKILNDWDPIGVLQEYGPIPYNEDGLKGEYSRYIKTIVKKFLDNESMNEYLIKLHTDLWDIPSNESNEEIRDVSSKIMHFLSGCDRESLEQFYKFY